MLSRRQTLKGTAAAAGLLICEAVAKPVTDVLIPRQSCGCPRIHELAYRHTCTVHDEKGRRWDSYTIEEILGPGEKIDVQTAETDWSCYCGRHDHPERDSVMPIGTRCVWRNVSYESDEWECDCVAAFIADWLNSVTTDWVAMAKEDGIA
jgi:hypothetical protein